MHSSHPRRSTHLLTLLALMTLLVLGLPGSLACGSDDEARGLAPSHETATPESDAEDAMTEAERREQQVRDLQQTEIEEFDRAENQ